MFQWRIFNSFVLNYFRYRLKMEVSSDIERALRCEIVMLRKLYFYEVSVLSLPGIYVAGEPLLNSVMF